MSESSEYFVCEDAYHSVADAEYNIWMRTMFSFRIKKTHFNEKEIEKLVATLCRSMIDRIKETQVEKGEVQEASPLETSELGVESGLGCHSIDTGAPEKGR